MHMIVSVAHIPCHVLSFLHISRFSPLYIYTEASIGNATITIYRASSQPIYCIVLRKYSNKKTVKYIESGLTLVFPITFQLTILSCNIFEKVYDDHNFCNIL